MTCRKLNENKTPRATTCADTEKIQISGCFWCHGCFLCSTIALRQYLAHMVLNTARLLSVYVSMGVSSGSGEPGCVSRGAHRLEEGALCVVVQQAQARSRAHLPERWAVAIYSASP